MIQPWQIENFLEIKNGRLHIDGVDAVELAREHGTPLFVYSEPRIRHNIDRLKKVQGVIGCPLKLCYAAKAMSTMGILRAVKDSGCDIEVNSGGELWKALKAGFTGDQINFNGNSKEVWELELAIENGIYAIQVDSLYELSLIEETAKRLGKKANVSLRLVPEIESDTHSGLQTALLTSKFGMMPDEAFSAFREYKDSPHLDLCGIHLHVGSQNPDPTVYTEALVKLFEAMERIYNETAIKLKHINLGGGFPVNYSRGKWQPLETSREDMKTMLELGSEQIEHEGKFMLAPLPPAKKKIYERELMFEAGYEPADAVSLAWYELQMVLAATKSAHLLSELTVLIEPGRSIIADAGICLTTVRSAKQRPVSEKTDNRQLTTDNWLLTDAGFNILLSMETYKWYYHLISAERSFDEHTFPYKVAGPLCDGGDVYFDIEGEGRLPEHRLLPSDVQPDEILALLNCGAYSLAQASQYNGRFLPPVVLVRENGQAEVIRRRETFEDLITSDL